MTFDELRVWAELGDRRRLKEMRDAANAARVAQADAKGWRKWEDSIRRALGE